MLASRAALQLHGFEKGCENCDTMQRGKLGDELVRAAAVRMDRTSHKSPARWHAAGAYHDLAAQPAIW